MKKLIIPLLLILILIYATLAALGTGGEYAAEKLFYHTMKNASKITMNPDVAPPAQLAAIERDLKLLLKKYPDTKIARIAHISLLEFYLSNKKYGEAMDLTKSIDTKYAGDTDILSTTQFLKGMSYEKQDKWDKALGEFKVLNEKYPNTRLGMEIPIYIGKYYSAKGLDNEASSAYRDAAAFYAKIERKYSDKMLGYTASLLLIQTYLNLKDYESAGKTLETTLHKYAAPASFMQLLPLVEKIYVQNLNNPDKAIELYKYVMSKAKNPKILKFLKQKINLLESKK